MMSIVMRMRMTGAMMTGAPLLAIIMVTVTIITKGLQ